MTTTLLLATLAVSLFALALIGMRRRKATEWGSIPTASLWVSNSLSQMPFLTLENGSDVVFGKVPASTKADGRAAIAIGNPRALELLPGGSVPNGAYEVKATVSLEGSSSALKRAFGDHVILLKPIEIGPNKATREIAIHASEDDMPSSSSTGITLGKHDFQALLNMIGDCPGLPLVVTNRNRAGR